MKYFRKINVIENLGYGCFNTDYGPAVVDIGDFGEDIELIEHPALYRIIDDERDENGNVLCFYV